MSQNMTHTITLKAVDGTSVVFQKIGQSAQASAAQVTSATQKSQAALNQEAVAADKAAASVTKLGTASTGAAKGISTIHAAVSGAAFATFLGFLSNAANAAAEDEAAFVRLETAVTATGQSYATYAANLDKAIVGAQRLSFSDDAAADALATLTAQTQDAAEAQQLLGVSMDLARGKHIDLGTAATIVGKVAQGNTAILQRYGIAIDANASSTEALAELQQRFSGQAEAFSNTQGGAIARVQENLDNFVESIGAALGPGQQWLALLPGVSAGMSLAGGAAAGLSKALFGVAEAEGAVAAAGATGGFGGLATGAAGLVAAINPLAAAGLATAAAIGILAKQVVDYSAAADAAADPTDTLRIAIAKLQEAGQDTSGPQALSDAWGDLSKTLGDYGEAQAKVVAQQQAGLNVDLGAQLRDDAQAARDLNLTVEERQQLEADLDAILANGNSNREKVIADTTALLTSYDGVNSTAPGVAAGVHSIASSLDTYDIAVTGATADTGNFVDFLDTMYSHLNAVQTQADATAQHLRNVSAGSQFVDPMSSLGVERPASQQASDAASLTAASNAQLAKDADDAARAQDEAKRAADAYAQSLQDERDAALQTADTLIGSQDEQIAQTQQLADAHEQYAERVGGINSDLAGQLGDLEESYGKTVAGIQEQRVEGEQAAADAMKQINEDRADVTIQAEQDIADVALERQRVMQEATRSSQEAERQFAEQQQQTVQAQAAVRDKLQATTQAATQQWHEAQQQDIEAQRQIRQELAAGIAEVERAFHDATAQAQQDLQRLAQDHRIAMQGFATDERRIREDLQLVLNDPRATAEQKNAAELQASRQLQDLNRQRKAEDLDHERSKKDLHEQEQQAAEDAARKEAELRQQAHEAQQQADEQRAAAQEAYNQAVSQANAQAQQQLQTIAQQQQSAAEDYQRTRNEISRQESESLADLNAKEQDIIAARAQSYQDLAEKRRGVEEDLAKKEDDLNKQNAEAAASYNESVNDAQQQAAEQRASAQKQYADSTKTDLTELQRLRDEGLLTEDEYQTAYKALLNLQDEAQAKEDARLATAAKTVGLLQEAAKVADPLDGPPRRAADPGDGPPRRTASPVRTTTLSADATAFRTVLTEATEAGKTFDASVFTATIAGNASLGGSGGAAQIGGGVQPFNAAVVAAELEGDHWSDEVFTATLAADWTDFARVYGDATSALDFFDKTTWTATLDADKESFDQVGQDAHQQGLNFSATTYTADINGDGDQFGTALADADEAGINFQNADPYTATISAQTDEDFQHVLTTAANDIHAITTNKTYYANISAYRTKLDQIVADIKEEFDGKAVATTYLDIVARVKDDTESSDRRSSGARKLGGMAALGTLVGEVGSELAIRGGRMWEVGAGGPEFLNLASGTLIMPHGAAQARMRGMALGGHATDSVPQMPTDGTRAIKAGSTINNYGTITLKVDNADVGNEIARQLAGRER